MQRCSHQMRPAKKFSRTEDRIHLASAGTDIRSAPPTTLHTRRFQTVQWNNTIRINSSSTLTWQALRKLETAAEPVGISGECLSCKQEGGGGIEDTYHANTRHTEKVLGNIYRQACLGMVPVRNDGAENSAAPARGGDRMMHSQTYHSSPQNVDLQQLHGLLQ